MRGHVGACPSRSVLRGGLHDTARRSALMTVYQDATEWIRAAALSQVAPTQGAPVTVHKACSVKRAAARRNTDRSTQ
jgi:hypothetical protein